MKKEYTVLKKLVDWYGCLLTLFIFSLDTFLGNVYKVVCSDDYVKQVYQYVSFEIFGLIPYILLIIISLNLRIRFDKFDISILFACLFLQILNCADFFLNYNWRPMWSDWVIFGLVALPSLILKYKTYETLGISKR